MKILAISLLLSVFIPAFLSAACWAQNTSAIAAAQAACGPRDTEFRVKLDSSQHPEPESDPAKALVYVIEDQKFKAVREVTARVAIDGAWVGATRGASYLSFSVAPGEHHLCADWLSGFLPDGRLVSLANFTAEAGKTYYFRVRTSGGPASLAVSKSQDYAASIDIDPVNSDEGKLLVAMSALSISQAKTQRASK